VRGIDTILIVVTLQTENMWEQLIALFPWIIVLLQNKTYMILVRLLRILMVFHTRIIMRSEVTATKSRTMSPMTMLRKSKVLSS